MRNLFRCPNRIVFQYVLFICVMLLASACHKEVKLPELPPIAPTLPPIVPLDSAALWIEQTDFMEEPGSDDPNYEKLRRKIVTKIYKTDNQIVEIRKGSNNNVQTVQLNKEIRIDIEAVDPQNGIHSLYVIIKGESQSGVKAEPDIRKYDGAKEEKNDKNYVLDKKRIKLYLDTKDKRKPGELSYQWIINVKAVPFHSDVSGDVDLTGEPVSNDKPFDIDAISLTGQ